MITFENLKPTSQGTLGVGVAIGYFSANGYIVSVPLSDNQKYDLLVDMDNEIKRVQVKTTGYKPKKYYKVQLKTICPKKTTKNKISGFDKTKVDYLFVITENGDMYNIPSSFITGSFEMDLSERFDLFKVKI